MLLSLALRVKYASPGLARTGSSRNYGTYYRTPNAVPVRSMAGSSHAYRTAPASIFRGKLCEMPSEALMMIAVTVYRYDPETACGRYRYE